MKPPPNPQLPLRYIKRIRAERLFGQFDHDLCFSEQATPKDPNLMVLYGENGTGKTTLLWIMYHLLNKAPSEGHRSFLARQRFKKISVTFSDETEMSVDRASAATGDFTMSFHRKAKLIGSYLYKIDKNGRITDLAEDKAHSKFTKSLPTFSFGFLPHDRLTKPDKALRELQHRLFVREMVDAAVEEKSPIQRSISNALGTARQKAIRASNQGQFSANAIYTELIRRIARVQPIAESTVGEKRTDLLRRLEHQAKLTHEFSKVGLIPELSVEELANTFRQMPHDRLDVATQVLEPFVQGNEARLKALTSLHIALTAMVETVNSLYINKRMLLHLEKGLQIATLTGEKLTPDQLSSGEQELLILFCEVVSALEQNTILFIDEPELSLNISWQKELLDALLRCASGSSVQFVIATHSIELLARHRANVVRLSSKIEGPLSPRTEVGTAES